MKRETKHVLLNGVCYVIYTTSCRKCWIPHPAMERCSVHNEIIVKT